MERRVSRDTIYVQNMQFYGRHGVNPEEKELGQRFEVDIELDLDTRPAGLSDDLTQTINYAHVFRLVKRLVEEECFDLIEALAETIAAQVGREFGPEAVRVRVRKPQAPLKGVFDYVAVAIERTPTSWQSPT